jgi:hypothetical protein
MMAPNTAASSSSRQPACRMAASPTVDRTYPPSTSGVVNRGGALRMRSSRCVPSTTPIRPCSASFTSRSTSSTWSRRSPARPAAPTSVVTSPLPGTETISAVGSTSTPRFAIPLTRPIVRSAASTWLTASPASINDSPSSSRNSSVCLSGARTVSATVGGTRISPRGRRRASAENPARTSTCSGVVPLSSTPTSLGPVVPGVEEQHAVPPYDDRRPLSDQVRRAAARNWRTPVSSTHS